MKVGSAITAAWLIGSLAACEKTEAVESVAASPNASILPAPLASSPQPVESLLPLSAAGAPPRATASAPVRLRSDAASASLPQPLRTDQAPEPDPLALRDLAGVTIEGEWHYPDLPLAPKVPETNLPGMEAARKLTALRWTVDLAGAGRLRILFGSRGFPLAQGTEIRSRADALGHLLVWASGAEYRVLPLGAVRTLLGERRVDAMPLVRAAVTGGSDGARRLGLATRKWEIGTRTGRLVLEQAHVGSAGEGGVLLCRLFLEIVASDPLSAPCELDEVPLHAQFAWPQGGSIVFEATALSDRAELVVSQIQVPPPSATFTASGLPPSSSGILLTRDEMAAIRRGPVDVGAPSHRGAPLEGVVAYNATEVMRYLFLDSLPVAWVLPNAEEYAVGAPRGRYLVQWRTFFGDAAEPARAVEVPARVTVGVPLDGGR